jgi:hypothetical protein
MQFNLSDEMGEETETSRWQTADTSQETADSKRQAVDSRQQTADSRRTWTRDSDGQKDRQTHGQVKKGQTEGITCW